MAQKKYAQVAAKRMDDAMRAAVDLLFKAREVVAESDNYAMAVDGPVLHSRQAMTDEQFDRMWARIAKARVLLEQCRR